MAATYEEILELVRETDRKHIKAWVPRYANNRIYGAMAWLSAEAGAEASAEAMVENRGLFSIRATGDSASILNPPAFRPRAC